MSAFTYMARFSFPKMCVTFNPGTDTQFTNSMKDFYSNSLEDLLKIDLHKNECIDMDKVSSYRRIIWKCINRKTDEWEKICEDHVTNDNFKRNSCKEVNQ